MLYILVGLDRRVNEMLLENVLQRLDAKFVLGYSENINYKVKALKLRNDNLRIEERNSGSNPVPQAVNRHR